MYPYHPLTMMQAAASFWLTGFQLQAAMLRCWSETAQGMTVTSPKTDKEDGKTAVPEDAALGFAGQDDDERGPEPV